MKLEELMAKTGDTMSVKKVYGEPFVSNGVTLVTAASVRGGAGGGEDGASGGSGSGFGLTARPVGAYQIKGDDVTWIPAADTTRVILVAQFIVVVALLVLRSILKARQRAA